MTTLSDHTERLLAELADGCEYPRDVAAKLRKTGIVGTRNRCGACPIARWLRYRIFRSDMGSATLRIDVCRDGVGVAPSLAAGREGVPLPDVLRRFVAAWDTRKGSFRYLEAE